MTDSPAMSSKKKPKRGRPVGSFHKADSELLKVGFNVRFTGDDARRIKRAAPDKEAAFIRTATIEKLNALTDSETGKR